MNPYLYCYNCQDFTKHNSEYCLSCGQNIDDVSDVSDDDEGPIWLSEEDELIAAYGRSNLDFVRNQHWVCDDLEHYLGPHES